MRGQSVRALAGYFFELPGEGGGVLVAKQGCGLLYGGAVAQEFHCLLLAVFSQPCFGSLARRFKKMPLQCAHGNFATFRQFCHRPIGLPGEGQPVLDVVQTGVHDSKCGMGSAPASGAVFRALAENEGRAIIFQHGDIA